MQLFITKPLLKGNRLIISEQNLIHQMSRVMRMKESSVCYIQHQDGEETLRWKVAIKSIGVSQIETDILHCQKTVKKLSKNKLIIALPNKFQKIELIVQKLTEIGVDEILFLVAQRSILKEISLNKMIRLEMIAKEAAEQSWGDTVPSIRVLSSLDEFSPQEYHCMICELPNAPIPGNQVSSDNALSKLLLVGPEGGWSQPDYELLSNYSFSCLTLGKTVLRTETAAIISAWHLINTFD